MGALESGAIAAEHLARALESSARTASLDAYDRSATDGFDEGDVRPGHPRGVRCVLRRHRHHHPFEELHAVVRRQDPLVDEGEIALDRERTTGLRRRGGDIHDGVRVLTRSAAHNA